MRRFSFTTWSCVFEKASKPCGYPMCWLRTVEDSDYHISDGEMSKYSNYAHDQALLGGCEVPDPDELLADINKLGEWRKNISERSDKLSKKRKRAGSMRPNRVNR